MINELIYHADSFKSLKNYLPHFVFLPIGHSEPGKVFMKVLHNNENYEAVLEK